MPVSSLKEDFDFTTKHQSNSSMAGHDHLEITNVFKGNRNMQSNFFFFCMNVRTMHKLEDGFSQQRPKETVIEIEAL